MGEQWLYTRPDFSKIPELYSTSVKKVVLHLPCLYSTGTKLSVFAPTARFCSFGSNWNNKIAQTEQLTTAEAGGGYITIDITDIVTDSAEHYLLYSEGLILKLSGISEDFAVIATGDNYALPQILEVHYD